MCFPFFGTRHPALHNVIDPARLSPGDTTTPAPPSGIVDRTTAVGRRHWWQFGRTQATRSLAPPPAPGKSVTTGVQAAASSPVPFVASPDPTAHDAAVDGDHGDPLPSPRSQKSASVASIPADAPATTPAPGVLPATGDTNRLSPAPSPAPRSSATSPSMVLDDGEMEPEADSSNSSPEASPTAREATPLPPPSVNTATKPVDRKAAAMPDVTAAKEEETNTICEIANRIWNVVVLIFCCIFCCDFRISDQAMEEDLLSLEKDITVIIDHSLDMKEKQSFLGKLEKIEERLHYIFVSKDRKDELFAIQSRIRASLQ